MQEIREAEHLAELVAEKLAGQLASQLSRCAFSPAEQEAIKDLLRTKRNAVRAFLWVCGAVMLWVLKDVYVYLASHLALK